MLEGMGFNGNYRIATIPNSLGKIGINGETVYLRTSDIAYILSRHNNQIQEEHFTKIADVIKNYDLVYKGKATRGSDTYKFYKLYQDSDGRKYGLEVGINRVDNTEEFVTHFQYIGRDKDRAEKFYNKILNSDDLVDFRRK